MLGQAQVPVADVFSESEPVLDVEDLRARVDGDEELVQELLQDFVRDVGPLVTAVVATCATSGRPLAAAAHRLRGMLLAVGATRSAGIASQIEVLAGSGAPADGARPLVDALEAAVAEARMVATAVTASSH